MDLFAESSGFWSEFIKTLNIRLIIRNQNHLRFKSLSKKYNLKQWLIFFYPWEINNEQKMFCCILIIGKSWIPFSFNKHWNISHNIFSEEKWGSGCFFLAQGHAQKLWHLCIWNFNKIATIKKQYLKCSVVNFMISDV